MSQEAGFRRNTGMCCLMFNSRAYHMALALVAVSLRFEKD